MLRGDRGKGGWGDVQGGLLLVDTAAVAQMLRLPHVLHLAIQPLTQLAVGAERQHGVAKGQEVVPWEGRVVVRLSGVSAVVAKSEEAPGESANVMPVSTQF